MLLGNMFDRFVKGSPIAVMARSLMEHALHPDFVDGIFARMAKTQYTRELLFSSLVDLMGPVVCGIRKSVHAAYQKSPTELGASATAVYDKLKGVEPDVAAELVRSVADRLAAVIEAMPAGKKPDLLPGYCVKILDGNCLAASEHRIFELRDIAAGPLPGKSLVVLDPALGLAIDVFPCEDGYAQERSLLDQVLLTIKARDVWVADRNFCTLGFLSGIARQLGYFVIRHHKNMPYEAISEWREVGVHDDSCIFERTVRIVDANGIATILRLLRIQFMEATRDGDYEIYLLTNLPDDVDGRKVSDLYRNRWQLETAFLHLTKSLRCEINTLGYPKAALFGFCVALVCYNMLATTRAALRSHWGSEKGDEQISNYYITDEIQGMYAGMMIALPSAHWTIFRTMPAAELANFLVSAAAHVNLRAFRKHPRGPKKPPTPRTKAANKPHVSTKRLLDARNKSP